MARRQDWQQQVLLASLLDRWIDPATTFATAIDNVARDATSGAMRRRRGVVAGLPDNLVVHRRRRTGCILVAIELKSRRGQCSRSQRLVRERLLRAGAQWWVCRSARSAMWALAVSGVCFRTLTNDDGTIERWQQPELPAWEVPKRDPHERRPRAPEWEPGAAAELAELAAASDNSAAGDIAA